MSDIRNMESNKEKYFAFFDVDETVISIKSMFDFLKYYFVASARYKWFGRLKFHCVNFWFKSLMKLGISRKYINKAYYRQFKGKKASEVEALGREWFELHKISRSFFNAEVIDELKKHQLNKARVIFVSGSFSACVNPIADYFEVDDVLATNLEKNGEFYTGNIILPQTIGKGKAKAVSLFLNRVGNFNLENSYAYGDHMSDLDMLKLVGNPVVVAGDESLEDYAKNSGWKIIS